MIKLSNTLSVESDLWFVIPAELQRATVLMLQSKAQGITNPLLRARAETILHDAVAYPDKEYGNSIWADHELAFYTNYGTWRVGSSFYVEQPMTKESILAEIKSFDAIDVETRVVPDVVLLK